MYELEFLTGIQHSIALMAVLMVAGKGLNFAFRLLQGLDK